MLLISTVAANRVADIGPATKTIKLVTASGIVPFHITVAMWLR